MRDAKELIHEAMVIEADNAANRTNNETFFAERDAAIAELESEREDAYAFALALALLTWLHGSQEPDARAELDAWMRAGVGVTGAKGADGRVRVRPAEEGEHVIGETMTDASGLQYVKTWPTFIDEVADFKPLTPENCAAINANSRAISAGPVNISAAFFQRPKAKP